MVNIKPNKQPCEICKDHKAGAPFKIRDDSGHQFTVSHITNCPYCGRFLAENYGLKPFAAVTKKYTSTPEGKAAFVAEVLSPLLKQADTGWNGAEYTSGSNGEYVFLLTPQGWRSKQIDITADSLEAIVREVFQSL